METFKPNKMTKREKDLTFFLGDALEKWIEKHKTERGELMCVLSTLCAVIFTEDTPFKGDITKQVREIDAFCNYLKFLAGRNK